MEEQKPTEFDGINLFEYKAMETKLHRELIQGCRRYINKLSIISIVGILDIVSQEIKELDKMGFKNTDEELVENMESIDHLR